MTVDVALAAVATIAAVGIVVDVSEMLTIRHTIADDFPVRVIATISARRQQRSFPWRLIDVDGSRLIAGQIARLGFALGAAAAALGSLPTAVFGVLALGAALAQVCHSQRLVLGLDGADQMMLIVWSGLAMTALNPSAGLVFIAAQSLLSYFVAGIAKVLGRSWRNGTAPREIVATSSYGSPYVERLFSRHPISLLVAWATIAFELVGPFAIIAWPSTAPVFILTAFGFHVSIAMAMGLNNFVWSFGAALPAVLWAATWLPWA